MRAAALTAMLRWEMRIVMLERQQQCQNAPRRSRKPQSDELAAIFGV